jgi:hypothetical protein
MSNANIIDLNIKTVKIPDNNSDRKKLNKMGFANTKESERTKLYNVPDKYLCEYHKEIIEEGGILGSELNTSNLAYYQ